MRKPGKWKAWCKCNRRSVHLLCSRKIAALLKRSCTGSEAIHVPTGYAGEGLRFLSAVCSGKGVGKPAWRIVYRGVDLLASHPRPVIFLQRRDSPLRIAKFEEA